MPQPAPPPTVAPETWRALLAVATDLSAFAPWRFAGDGEIIGLGTADTSNTLVANVLGNAGEVFGAVVYRQQGVHWLMSMLDDESDSSDAPSAEGMDCLMVEFVSKKELTKEDLAVCKAAGFKPAGSGPVWPQFRSSKPGWCPWFIDEAEANQLLADLPRITAFMRLLERHPDLFDERSALEIPYLPKVLPSGPLSLRDLTWRLFEPPPVVAAEPYRPKPDDLKLLRALPHHAEISCEYDSSLMPSGSFFEEGRPCFGRVGLLVETDEGAVLGLDIQPGPLPPDEIAGLNLVLSLLKAELIPGTLIISNPRFQAVLAPLCKTLNIRLKLAGHLPLLVEAREGLTEFLMTRGGGQK